jgi:exonuclease III
MRLVSWNVRGGNRLEVVDAVRALRPDVAVLVDCKARHVERIVAEAAAAGYKHHLARCIDYTGIVMLSAHPLTHGEIDQVPVPHRWLHAVSDHWGLEIAAMYGPLPETIRDEPTMTEFWNWLVPACDLLVNRQAVLCGDFNTGISGVDSPADYRFSCVSQFRDLANHGWKDAYRELHPEGGEHSWWNKERGFRIDHCMLSRGHPVPGLVAYPQEIAGTRLARSHSDPNHRRAISDHAPLVLET